jgi:uncharacterized protein with von Willebrand factor type A (vWA) domain
MFKRFFFNRRNTYSRWDGSQRIEGIDADDVLEALADDYLRGTDLRSALQRLQMQGFRGREGQQVMGLREMLDRLRQQQQQRMRRYDMSGVMDDIRQKLDAVKQHEREGIQRRLSETAEPQPATPSAQDGSEGPMPGEQQAQQGEQSPGQSGQSSQRGQMGQQGAKPPEGVDPAALRKALEQIAQRKMDFLDQLPRDPAGQIRELSNYDFMDAQAREEFQELLQMLQQQVMQQYFQGMQQALSQMTPEEMARMRAMIQALNQMLRDRENGIEPDFDSFMQQYGDFFGPGINTLDDLLDEMQRRSAQMEAVLDSMPQEQREQLQDMMDQLLGDDRMRVDLAELAQHIANQRPQDYNTRYRFSGDESLTLTEAMALMGELQGLDELEAQMNAARRKGDLSGVDAERLRDLMGEEDAAALEELKDLMRQLEEAGYITRNGTRWQLTSQGIRKVGQKALQDMFAQLDRDAFGQHVLDRRGVGGERTDDTKPYTFGDPFLLDVGATIRNAVERDGPGLPLRVDPADFEVYQTELLTQSSTVLMIDMSLSMIYSQANVAAKKVAVALEALIRGQFPRDNLSVVGFSRTAREFKRDELVEISEVDHNQGTNMVHGLMLARHLLARHKSSNKQIIMVTDGSPTVMWNKPANEWEFVFPWGLELAEMQTLLEVQRCTRENIRINTFMLVRDPDLIAFVRKMSEINKGRAFFTTPEDLGRYLLVDYLASKQVFRQ